MLALLGLEVPVVSTRGDEDVSFIKSVTFNSFPSREVKDYAGFEHGARSSFYSVSFRPMSDLV